MVTISNYIYAAIKVGDWYQVSIRKDMVTPLNNYILRFHLRTHQWFLLEESVYDMTPWHESILGVDDSIYELYKGRYPAISVVYTKELVPEGSTMLGQRNLCDLRILMEASSVDELDLQIEGEFSQESASGLDGLNTMPSRQSSGARRFPVPHWNSRFLYADSHPWMSPRDVWIGTGVDNPVPGFSHNIKLTFPVGHLVRLKALGITFGDELRSTVR